MRNVQPFQRVAGLSTIRIEQDEATDAHWCFMHAKPAFTDPSYRACFSPELLRELRIFARQTIDAIAGQAAVSETHLAHIVLASDAHVFNLGGDLDLFCRLIRARDRDGLLHYAHECVDSVHLLHTRLHPNAHTIALVEGDALGGGLELALACQTIDAIAGQAAVSETHLAHIVLASDAHVFNLGGDLDLFCRLIRARDRDGLLHYAHECVDSVHLLHTRLHPNAHTIALVEGDALGGGLELALACQTIVAESGVQMGFPEVLFGLFPGMGAYSLLSRRIGPKRTEEMMLNGTIYSSDEMHAMGIVDVLVPKGEGARAVREVIRQNRRIAAARLALHRVRDEIHPVPLDELVRITDIWVDTALQLGDKSLRMMERLVRAQLRRPDDITNARDTGFAAG